MRSVIHVLAEGLVLSLRDKWRDVRFVLMVYLMTLPIYQLVEGRMMKSFMNSKLEESEGK